MPPTLSGVSCVTPLAGDVIGHAGRLVDLDIVSGVGEQVQLAIGEQVSKLSCDVGVEVPVACTEHDPHRRGESTERADSSQAAEYRAEQVVVESPERPPGGRGVAVKLRHPR